ncbi:MAG TPA: sterol desaturase family protein [Xanthobacteraceae bacterium]
MDLSAVVLQFFKKLQSIFFSSGSTFSLTSLLCALCIAAVFVVIKRRQKNRPIRFRTLVRALFPKRITASPSHGADIAYFFLAVFVFGLVFGWAVLSYQVISNGVTGLLVATFGAIQPTVLPEIVSRSSITLVLFLAYELAYWLDHYLSHRVPILWEFHKVHHSANVLTPLTVFRVHPVDSVVFGNIVAIVTGIANGSMNYVFGITAYQYAVTDSNIILVLFVHAYVHLQHTHLWIPFRGVLGRILQSPAHHQIHHSDNPVHFNKNLGSCLAVWDWLFGTLYIPRKEPERLNFGIDPSHGDVHSIAHGLVDPIFRAASHLTPAPASNSPVATAVQRDAPPS